MDAKEYIRERERMLDSLGRTCGRCGDVLCSKCYLHSSDTARVCLYNTEESVDFVETWSNEHPKKTYLDVLLEAFPGTIMVNGSPYMCPHQLGLEPREEIPCRITPHSCYKCWRREYKEAANE